MKVAIFGLGYVGLIAAGCLSSQEHEIVGVDVNEWKVQQINAGKSTIVEPGLDELIRCAVSQKLLFCTTNIGSLLDECDIALVCVGTPSGIDGAHNMSFIIEVTRQLANGIRRRSKPLCIVYRSTLRPGTIEDLVMPIISSSASYDEALVEIVYNPEFLREAKGIEDFFHPPKIVVGTKDGLASSAIEKLNYGINAPTFVTPYREAEFTKFVDNTFHGLKVAFGNEIGRICLKLGMDASIVHDVFVADEKLNISKAYFRPGGAFGGSCLPKDIRALQHISADVGAATHLIDSLMRSNDAHKHFLYDRITMGLERNSHILLVGLAFKDGSDDLRESPKIDLARKILASGYRLSIYDPSLVPSQLVGQNLGFAFSQLPSLEKLLVQKEEIIGTHYSLLVDSVGQPLPFRVDADHSININTL